MRRVNHKFDIDCAGMAEHQAGVGATEKECFRLRLQLGGLGRGAHARVSQPFGANGLRRQFQIDDPHDAGLVALVRVGFYVANWAEVDITGL